MTLVDTGRLVALFDPQNEQHNRCRKTLKEIREPVFTTIPVLTEAFHMLGPASIGSDSLREFMENGGYLCGSRSGVANSSLRTDGVIR